MSKPMGRPRKSIDPAQLEQFLSFFPTIEETARFFACSESTIKRYIADHYEDHTYDSLRALVSEELKQSLRSKVIAKAKEGDNFMLALCMKHVVGWNDNVAPKTPDEKPFELAYNAKQIRDVEEVGEPKDGEATKTNAIGDDGDSREAPGGSDGADEMG